MERDADDFVPRVDEPSGCDRGIDSAAHGYDDAHLRGLAYTE
jgi:hypothetical protein